MHVEILGGGPAGLTLAILLMRDDQTHQVRVVERGPRGATWGFGVVFSDRALDFLRADAPELHDLLTPRMQSWRDLTIVHGDTRVPIGGNGFASIGRLELLGALQREAERLGAGLEFDRPLADVRDLGEADLRVAADGAFSASRDARPDAFGTRIDWRHNRFVWYGTTLPFDTLTLTFRPHALGVFCAHHYRYAVDRSTFLVEVDEATYRRAGFDAMNEADSLRLCEQVFAPDLRGHRLLSNRSTWRRFPAIWNERFFDGRTVLIGDALRTVHFSIGSGTRLAMEDAIALAKALRECARIDDALAQFQRERQPPMRKIWDAANVSLRWYEGMGELMALDPHEFAYRYMTRSGRVGHDEVRRRDPALAQAYERLHPERFG
ncbi:MAG TPA: FAD-dependent monooxygenase [Burkholderiaceae bacterium]|nr:FAD-dependent monooxygenase [Burkholderiaceae bacterium]